jgi:phosphatidylglycerophosphatase C
VAGASAPRTVAVFDFDGTLTRGDTLLPFLRRVGGGLPLAGALLAGCVRLGLAPAGYRRDRAKEAVLARVMAGESVERLAPLADAYAADLVARRLLPPTCRRLEWHRESGHAVVIVSASPELYVSAVGRRLGVDAVLGTRLEVGDDGRLTGRLAGPNCRGPEKAVRLQAWLGPGPAQLWCYGDSAGDAELLALADHPVRVRRRRIPDLPQEPPLPLRQASDGV